MTNNVPQRLGVVLFGDLTASWPFTYIFSSTVLLHERNKHCWHCGAWKWKEETTNYCSSGDYAVEPSQDLPPGIELIFTERQFLRDQRKYNGLFSLTMLGAAPTPTWTQPAYPSMLQLRGRAYHRIMDAFRGQYDERTPVVNKARMYIYDAEMMQQARYMNG